MTSADRYEIASPHSAGASLAPDGIAPSVGIAVPFESVLWEGSGSSCPSEEAREPSFFTDLNLDQLLDSITAGREQYDLKSFFYAPLDDVTAVGYRHEVLHDLQRPDVLDATTAFAGSMRLMREHLDRVERLHYELQKQAWFLDAVKIYCDAVCSLAAELASLNVTSRGLRGVRDYLSAYVRSLRVTELVAETKSLKDALAGIRYAVRIQGERVTVSRYEGEPDYTAEVEETFARFKQGAVASYLVRLRDSVDMNHVEAQIADRVARLHPDTFSNLADYRASRRDYLDPTVGRFDREVQFYLAYLELVGRLEAAGLAFCYPDTSTRSKKIAVKNSFDVALANKLVQEGGGVVCNDFNLDEPERVFVVSGPNNGGKTTFARTFGQLHYLASLGLLVPGSSARLFLPDRIYTHFEREENIETLRGKLEDELVRVHEILDHATPSSVIIMNESFNSTTLNDALYIGSEVMLRILDRGCLGVYVTFVDEIASLGQATVSMVSQIVPNNPAQRTFKIVRRPADGLAYAWAIAEKYGLTFDRLVERIGS
jgi:DNA mismatch repair protein MutS